MSDKEIFVVGLAGKIGSGKTTAALFLEKALGFIRIPFADQLRLVAESIIGDVVWEKPTPPKVRTLLQKLGTDVGRSYDPDVWVSKWVDHVRGTSLWSGTSLTRVVVDDVRFLNEVRAVETFGGVVMYINRPDNNAELFPEQKSHCSEQLSPDYFYTVIENRSSIERLCEEVLFCLFPVLFKRVSPCMVQTSKRMEGV